MREKGGSGTFARRMEEALAPLLFFLFVILPLYLSITNPSLSLLAATFFREITLLLLIFYHHLYYLPVCPSTLLMSFIQSFS